ncbi:MAG: pirin family protein [Bacteroidota bacterium]
MRSIKKIHTAESHPIADLVTYSPLPTRQLQQIDPFIFLNHHGFQVYSSNNRGLPFGPHPHRGMETVTFIIEGDIMHKDSEGFQSIISAGGIQWMTAGSGLLHSEVSSPEFKKNGGNLEILQMWLNLPARLKMTKPHYKGLQKEDIPSIAINEKVTLNLISGDFEGNKGAFESLTNIFLSTISINSGGESNFSAPNNHNIFLYLIRGNVSVNGQEITQRQLVEFDNDDDILSLKANTESLLIFGHAKPFNEPMVAQGPFVMNTQQEIAEAYRDFQLGRFGIWKD